MGTIILIAIIYVVGVLASAAIQYRWDEHFDVDSPYHVRTCWAFSALWFVAIPAQLIFTTWDAGARGLEWLGHQMLQVGRKIHEKMKKLRVV